jgi:acid phosphatase class B
MKNIGFDFDGVIHIDVTETDKFGQRHPNCGLYRIPKTPFDKIINLIKVYHINAYNIYIITSRSSKSKKIVLDTLDKFNLNNIIKEENIYFTGDIYNGDKTIILEKLNISEFYDDSIIHLKAVCNEKNNNKLKYLKKFYLTIPEKDNIMMMKF